MGLESSLRHFGPVYLIYSTAKYLTTPLGYLGVFEHDLRPGHTGPDNENENEHDTNARPRLVELLHAEYAQAYLHQSRACIFVVVVVVLVIGACVTGPLCISWAAVDFTGHSLCKSTPDCVALTEEIASTNSQFEPNF